MTEVDLRRDFAAATAIVPVGSGAYVADLDQNWSAVGNINGGYLQAVMARAAAAESVHPHVVAASTHFLRSPDAGNARLVVEPLRTGRSASQVRVRLLQEDEAKAETVFMLGDLSGIKPDPAFVAADFPARGLAFDEVVRFKPPRDAFPVELLRQVELYLEPESLGFTQGNPRGLGQLRGWLDLPGQGSFDPVSLLQAADTFPPATFDINPGGWVPTFEMTTYIRALPVPGPVQIFFQAHLVQGDRVDETCTIWDSEGTVVAQSHQLAGVRW
jgi:hypothetical protein